MDVLFASEVLVPAVGGAERTMLEWAHGLRERGHTVRTVCLPVGPRPSAERYWRGRAEQRAEIGSLVAAAVAERRPDVVVAQLHGAPAALAAGALAGVPGVLVVPSYESLCKLAFAPGSSCAGHDDCLSCPCARRLLSAERAALAASRVAHDTALANASAVIAPSGAVAAAIGRWSGREANVVWPVGPELPAPADTSPDGAVICAAAVWSDHKGNDERAVHVTEQGLQVADRERIGAAGGTLVPRASIDELLAGASLVLVPSQWDEPYGRIAWEALARGVPTLASDAGGLADCVPAAQRVAPRDDLRAWSAAIQGLLSSRDAWSAAGASGRRHAAAMLLPAPLQRLETVLEHVLADLPAPVGCLRP
jgi:hypothetical protein